MATPPGSVEGVSEDNSEDDFELIDEESSSSHEDFLCYQDDDWSVLLPSEAETGMGAFDCRDCQLPEAVNITAGHSSLLSASLQDFTHSAGQAGVDVLLREENMPTLNVNGCGETLQFLQDRFDGDNTDADIIQEERQFLDSVEVPCERLHSVEGDIDVDGEHRSDFYIMSLTDIAFRGMNSDCEDPQLHSQGNLGTDDDRLDEDLSRAKKLLVASHDAVISGIHSSEERSLHRGNDDREIAAVEKNVPTPHQHQVFERDEISDTFCYVNFKENNAHDSLGMIENIFEDATLIEKISSEESSYTRGLDVASSEETEIEPIKEVKDSDKALSGEKCIASAIFPLNEFDDGDEGLADSELDSDSGETELLLYDHFPEQMMNRKVDRFGCRLRKKQRRSVIRDFTWKSCYYHY